MSAPEMRRTALTLAAAAAAGAAIVLATAACTDFDAPSPSALPDVLVAAPSYSRDIAPIFEARCATAGCHTNVTRQGALPLSPPDSAHVYLTRYGLVNPTNPCGLVPILRTGCPQAGIPRMPLGQPPLTENQIQTIVNWIAQGAQKN